MVTVRRNRQQVLEFDVQRYQQGGRVAYSLFMNLGMLDSNVPNFVNPDRIERANRRFNATHSKKIAEYMYEREDWVLGAILLGIDPTYVEFEPYPENNGQPSDRLGYIRISLDGGTSSIRILDGQHRRMAIQSVRERLRQEIAEEKTNAAKNGSHRKLKKLERKFQRLNNMAISVVLYEEADTKKLRQMFADLARTRPIDQTTKTRFDERDPFNRAAVDIVENRRSKFLADKIEMERTTPVRSSNNLLSISQLARCLKELKYGFGSRKSRDRIREVEEHYEELIYTGIKWADEFLPRARQEYEVLCSTDIEEDFVSKNRASFVSYTVTVLQLMSSCFYQWSALNRPWHELADWLREADFDVASEECIFLKTGMLAPGDSILVSQTQRMRATIAYIISQATRANN